MSLTIREARYLLDLWATNDLHRIAYETPTESGATAFIGSGVGLVRAMLERTALGEDPIALLLRSPEENEERMTAGTSGDCDSPLLAYLSDSAAL